MKEHLRSDMNGFPQAGFPNFAALSLEIFRRLLLQGSREARSSGR